jgi:hypothetical protein
MAVCFHCGAAMRSRRRALTGRRMYRCSNAMEGRISCTVSRPVPAEDAERELIAKVVGYMPDLDGWLREQAQGHRAEWANAERALQTATKVLEATEKRLERLLDDYEELPPDEARLVLRRAAKVEAERYEAEQRVYDLEAVVAEHDDDPDVDAARELYVRLLAFAQGRLDSVAAVMRTFAGTVGAVRSGALAGRAGPRGFRRAALRRRGGAPAPLELVPDLHDRIDRRQDLAAEVGELVLDRGGRGGHDPALDDAVGDQPPEAVGQHLRRDAVDVAAQLVEAPRALAQVPEDVRRPGASEEGHALGERALLRGWIHAARPELHAGLHRRSVAFGPIQW